MHNLTKLLVSSVLVAAQATVSVQPRVAASTAVPSPADVSSQIIQLNPSSPQPLTVQATPRPDFDNEVLAPLRAAQAAQAAATAAKAVAARQAVRVVYSPRQSAPATPENWQKLRQCESGNDYTNKHNPRYRGAYQFAFGTWGNYGGYYDPADAPAAVQDAKAQMLFNSSGWRPWGCAYSLGFL